MIWAAILDSISTAQKDSILVLLDGVISVKVDKIEWLMIDDISFTDQVLWPKRTISSLV